MVKAIGHILGYDYVDSLNANSTIQQHKRYFPYININLVDNASNKHNIMPQYQSLHKNRKPSFIINCWRFLEPLN